MNRFDLTRKAFEKVWKVFVYGFERTIHGTSTIDIQVNENGKVVRVWFRCLNLAWRVSKEGTGKTLYEGTDGAYVQAIITDELI